MVYLFIGIAGALGAILRYIIGILFFPNTLFPFATLTVNLAGSFLLAWLTTSFFKRIPISPMLAHAIGSGFIGSFTTFSMFSVETVAMINNGFIFLGIIYMFLSVTGGIFMGRLGFKIGKRSER